MLAEAMNWPEAALTMVGIVVTAAVWISVIYFVTKK